MEKEKISVIVPIYNVEKYLDRCIASVCAQSYQNLEIILVDDGSPDGCGKICDSWEKKDTRIKVVHQINGGLSKARNAGLEVAGGDYIGFVDSDDYIHPQMYETLVTTSKETGCQVVMCPYQAVDEEGKDVQQIKENLTPGVYSFEKLLTNMYRNSQFEGTCASVCNKLFSRELLKQLRFKEGIGHEDEAFMNDYMVKTEQIAVIEPPLYFYVQRQGSIMHSEFSLKRIDRYYALKQRLLFCADKGYNEDCIRANTVVCISQGIDLWLRSVQGKLLSKEQSRKLHADIAEVIERFRKYGTRKKQIHWSFFQFFPKTRKTLYFITQKAKGFKHHGKR